MAEKNINTVAESELSNIEDINDNESHEEALSKVDSSADVMNLMEGVDTTPSEKVSTRKEQARQIAIKKKQPAPIVNRPLPSKNVIKRKVIESIKQEEAIEIAALAKLEHKPYEYAEKVKKIRSLRQKLTELLHDTFDKIKDRYLKLFGDKHGFKNEE